MSEIQRFRHDISGHPNGTRWAVLKPDDKGSVVYYSDYAHLLRSHEALERVGERAAREIVGCFDVAPTRGKSYANSVTQTIAIIIQQQIRAALTEAAALEPQK